MVKRNVYNMFKVVDPLDREINIGMYRFIPKSTRLTPLVPVVGYTPHRLIARHNRTNRVTAQVEFSGRQKESLLYRGGMHTRTITRKQIDDVLTLISLLTGCNVELSSRRLAPQFPTVPTNHLEMGMNAWQDLEVDMNTILTVIDDPTWQTKYLNGYHLRSLLNRSQLGNLESRFLSMVVSWEWLHSVEFGRESYNLNEIHSNLLALYWGSTLNTSIFNSSKHTIFNILRNQLAHNGTLPINRRHSEAWMQALSFEAMKAYIKFFTRVTHILVMKTIEVDLLSKNTFNTVFNVDTHLSEYLASGRIHRFNSL